MKTNPVPESKIHGPIDFTDANVVIQIGSDGKMLWLNVNGVCVVRCCNAQIKIEDLRYLRTAK